MDEKAKEPTPELVQEVTDGDFEVFYRLEAPSASHPPPRLAQTTFSQEEAHASKGMGFEERTPNLMALLEAYTRSASPAIPVMPMVPRPPTLAPEHASSSDATDKKIKRGQGGKGPEDAEK